MSTTDSTMDFDDRLSDEGDLPSLPPEEKEHLMRSVLDAIDDTLARQAVPPSAVSQVRLRSTPAPPARPKAHVGPTEQMAVWSGDTRPQGVHTPTFGMPPVPRALAALAGTSRSEGTRTFPLLVPAADGSWVKIPRLSTQEYASLRAELAVGLERVATILTRYVVESETALLALCAWWDAYLATHADTWEAFARVFPVYVDYVRRRDAQGP